MAVERSSSSSSCSSSSSRLLEVELCRVLGGVFSHQVRCMLHLDTAEAHRKVPFQVSVEAASCRAF